MKKQFLPVIKVFVATIAGIGFSSWLLAQPSSAQVSPTDAFPNGSTTDENTNPFSRSNSDNFNMFDLIHRANFGTLNWDTNEQNQQLDSAAAAFKARQQRLLQGQQQQGQVTPSLPAITPGTSGSATPPVLTLPSQQN